MGRYGALLIHPLLRTFLLRTFLRSLVLPRLGSTFAPLRRFVGWLENLVEAISCTTFGDSGGGVTSHVRCSLLVVPCRVNGASWGAGARSGTGTEGAGQLDLFRT